MREVIQALGDRFIELLYAPFTTSEMLWIITPLFLTLILVELYFARYKFEEAGWNVAYTNAIVLIFVSLDLLRFLYMRDELYTITLRNALAIIVGVLGVLFTVSNFLHLWSRELAFGISGKLPTNFIAYVSIIIIYAQIPINFITVFASLGILVLFFILIKIIRIVVPKAIELDEEELAERENAPSPRTFG